MGTLVRWIGRFVEALLVPFDLLPERVALVVLSVVSGVLVLLAFRALTNQRAIETARDRMASAVYELRLFIDSPVRIVSAQLRLFRYSLLYVAHAIPAMLVMAIPLAVLFVHLEARYGLDPAGTSDVLVRLALAPDADPRAVEVESSGVEPTAPPVWVAPTRELYYRVRVTNEASSTLRFRTPSGAIDKQVSAGRGARRIDAERARGAPALLAVGTEPPLPETSLVDELHVAHEPRRIALLGITAAWWVHWLVISSLVALGLGKRLGVTF